MIRKTAIPLIVAGVVLLAGCGTAAGGSITGSDTGASPYCQQDTPNSLAGCLRRGPMGDNGLIYTVTAKYHNDQEGMWCVESRAIGDPHDHFDRTCIPDATATTDDRQWLGHQIVGSPAWERAQ